MTKNCQIVKSRKMTSILVVIATAVGVTLHKIFFSLNISKKHICMVSNLSVGFFAKNYMIIRNALKFCFAAQPNRHLMERIFWIVAFLVGMLFAGYLISDVWRRYQTSPVILAFDPHDLSISDIPFPAVTICNINKVQKKFAQQVQRYSFDFQRRKTTQYLLN